MTKPFEIQQKARLVLVRDLQVENDFILFWILLGIATHGHLSLALAFNGETVLQQAHFEVY